MKKLIFTLLVALLIYTVIELLSFSALKVLKKFRGVAYNPIPSTSLSREDQETLQNLIDGKTMYFIHSPVLGWTIKPNGTWHDLYKANSQGIRGNKAYQLLPGKDSIRIATFGDSFTHCDSVRNCNTWQRQLEKLNPELEVLNFGVGAYGLDQAFLRYKYEGVLYNANIICIGFMSENIYRLVNVFRPFYFPGLPLTKPRFLIRKNKLVILKNPLQSLNDYKSLLKNPQPLLAGFGRNDYHFKVSPKKGALDFLPSVRFFKLLYYICYKKYLSYCNISILKHGYYNKDSEAFKICIRLFNEFYDTAQKNKSLPIIILFPNYSDIKRYRENKTKMYSPLIQYLNSCGYRYIDLMDAFQVPGKLYPLERLFVQNHYSPLANQVSANFILNYLNKNVLPVN